MAIVTSANARLAAIRTLPDRYLREVVAAMEERRRALGRRIAQARNEKHWKQKQLAAAVNVEPMTVSRWERGQHAPDIDMLERIAEATGKPLAYFVDDPAAESSELTVLREELAETRGLVAQLTREFRAFRDEQREAPPAARPVRRRAS